MDTSKFGKFKRRLIRTISTHIRENTSNDDIWKSMKESTGCDCKVLWKHMRVLTVKKLNRLLQADDYTNRVVAVARMTVTDWMMYDLVLVNEDIDVIGVDNKKNSSTALSDLLDLVERFQVEEQTPETIAGAWVLVAREYNKCGRNSSPMLLQKRWYQMKKITRATIYAFWFAHHKEMHKANTVPKQLYIEIARRFPSLIISPFEDWNTLLQRNLVAPPDEFVKKTDSDNKTKNTDPDLIMLEPRVETIDLDQYSDSEESSESRRDSVGLSKSLIPDVAHKNYKAEENSVNFTSMDTDEYLSLDVHKTSATINGSAMSADLINSSKHIETDSYNIGTETDNATSVTKENYVPVLDSLAENFKLQQSIETDIDQGIKREDNHIEDDLICLGHVDGLSQVKIVETAHIPQEIITKTEPATFEKALDSSQYINLVDNTKLSPMEIDNEILVSENATDTCKSKLEDTNKDNAVPLGDMRMSALEIIDDGIEFIEEDTLADKVNHKNLNCNDEYDPCCLGSMKNDLTDPNLLKIPVVYTKKLDDMIVLKNKDFTNLIVTSLLNIIIKESKPNISKIQSLNLIKEPDSKPCVDSNTQKNICEVQDINKSEDNLYNEHRIKSNSRLLKKPRNLKYNPILLCKNPDFNTRLKRLSVGFLTSSRNRQFLKACQPLTIDLDKGFENKLVNGTLYLKDSGELETDSKKILKSESAFNSVIPSAMPAQSLIDNINLNIEDILPQTARSHNSKDKLKVFNSTAKGGDIKCNTTIIPKKISKESVEFAQVVNKDEYIDTDRNETTEYLTKENIRIVIKDNVEKFHNENIDKMVEYSNSFFVEIPENKKSLSTIDKGIESIDKIVEDSNSIFVEISENKTSVNTIDKANESIDEIVGDSNIISADIPDTINKISDNNGVGANEHVDKMTKSLKNIPAEIHDNNVMPSSEIEVCDTQNVISTENSSSLNEADSQNIIKAKPAPKSKQATMPWFKRSAPLKFDNDDRLLTIDTLNKILYYLCPIKLPTKPNKVIAPKTVVKSAPRESNKIELSDSNNLSITLKEHATNTGQQLHSIQIKIPTKRKRRYAPRRKRICCWVKSKANKIFALGQGLIKRVDVKPHPCFKNGSNICLCCCKSNYEWSKTLGCLDTGQNIPEDKTLNNANEVSQPYLISQLNRLKTPHEIQKPNNPVLNYTNREMFDYKHPNMHDNAIPKDAHTSPDTSHVGSLLIQSENGKISIDGTSHNSHESYVEDLKVHDIYIIRPNKSTKPPLKLGNNLILMTTVKCHSDSEVSPSKEQHVEPKKIILSDTSYKLPKDVELLLLPNGQVTAALGPNSDLTSEDKLVEIQNIITSVQENISKIQNNLFQNCKNDIYNLSSTINCIEPQTEEISNTGTDKQSLENTNSIKLQNDIGQETSNHNKNIDESNKKSILSDLMEMSGITMEDNVMTESNISYNESYCKEKSESSTILELTTVTSIQQIVSAQNQKAKFYTLNFETGKLGIATIKVSKKLNTSDSPRKMDKNNVIDVLDSDEECVDEQIKVITKINSKDVILGDLLDNHISPLKGNAKKHRSRKQVLKKSVSSQMSIEPIWTEIVTDSSDEEPLAKKVKRKNNVVNNDNITMLRRPRLESSFKCKNVSSMLNINLESNAYETHLDNDEDSPMTEFLNFHSKDGDEPVPVFISLPEESETDEDCILGV